MKLKLYIFVLFIFNICYENFIYIYLGLRYPSIQVTSKKVVVNLLYLFSSMVTERYYINTDEDDREKIFFRFRSRSSEN